MGFPRKEYWSGLPFPPPGDLPHPGIKPKTPALAGRFFATELPGKLIQMPLSETLLWNYDGLGIKHWIECLLKTLNSLYGIPTLDCQTIAISKKTQRRTL